MFYQGKTKSTETNSPVDVVAVLGRASRRQRSQTATRRHDDDVLLLDGAASATGSQDLDDHVLALRLARNPLNIETLAAGGIAVGSGPADLDREAVR